MYTFIVCLVFVSIYFGVDLYRNHQKWSKRSALSLASYTFAGGLICFALTGVTTLILNQYVPRLSTVRGYNLVPVTHQDGKDYFVQSVGTDYSDMHYLIRVRNSDGTIDQQLLKESETKFDTPDPWQSESPEWLRIVYEYDYSTPIGHWVFQPSNREISILNVLLTPSGSTLRRYIN